MLFFRRGAADEQAKQRNEDTDEPPDDFREIQIFPQTADMQVLKSTFVFVGKIGVVVQSIEQLFTEIDDDSYFLRKIISNLSVNYNLSLLHCG